MRNTTQGNIFYVGLFLSAVVAMLAMLFGYIYNLIWIFTSTGEATGQFVLSIVGALIPVIGAVHGLAVFFL